MIQSLKIDRIQIRLLRLCGWHVCGRQPCAATILEYWIALLTSICCRLRPSIVLVNNFGYTLSASSCTLVAENCCCKFNLGRPFEKQMIVVHRAQALLD